MCKLMILLFCPFLASVTSLALFSAMNEEQRVLLLKRELSRLFLVSKMFVPGINKIKLLNMVAWRYEISLLVFN